MATYYTIIYVILGGLLRLALDGFISFQQKIQLEKQNINNELALLRTQINPHFLFNTLNTIHSYIISKNPASAEAVIKLSDIMRYMLYDAGKEEITLEQELDYLRSYISWPTISWPGNTACPGQASSPATMCRSVRQTPQAAAWMRTWPGDGRGRPARHTCCNGRSGPSICIARQRGAGRSAAGCTASVRSVIGLLRRWFRRCRRLHRAPPLRTGARPVAGRYGALLRRGH